MWNLRYSKFRKSGLNLVLKRCKAVFMLIYGRHDSDVFSCHTVCENYPYLRKNYPYVSFS